MAGYARRLSVKDISAEYLDESESGNVAAAGQSIVTITAPAGYIYKIKNMRLYAPDPSGSSSGTHQFTVYNGVSADLGILFGKSNSGTGLLLTQMRWSTANNTQGPTDEISQITILKDMVIDETNGLKIKYDNDTDAAQTADRKIELWVIQERVA